MIRRVRWFPNRELGLETGCSWDPARGFDRVDSLGWDLGADLNRLRKNWYCKPEVRNEQALMGCYGWKVFVLTPQKREDGLQFWRVGTRIVRAK